MLMQRLDHPAIPKIVDCVETEEDCYLIMEYIKGSLWKKFFVQKKIFPYRKRLQEERRLPEYWNISITVNRRSATEI